MSAELRSAGDYKIFPAGVSRAQELIIAKNSLATQIGSVRVLPDLLYH
jgi:hypothetical protein